MNSRYYNYSVNMNGKKIKHGFDYSRDYYPDLIANDSVAFLRQSKHNFARKPVMLVASFPAPHGPEDSAPQFSHLFFNVTTHQWVQRTFWLSIPIFCKRDVTLGSGTHTDSYRRLFCKPVSFLDVVFSLIRKIQDGRCVHMSNRERNVIFRSRELQRSELCRDICFTKVISMSLIRFCHPNPLRLIWNLIKSEFCARAVWLDSIFAHINMVKIRYIGLHRCVKQEL